jgi:5'-3' exonuclease
VVNTKSFTVIVNNYSNRFGSVRSSRSFEWHKLLTLVSLLSFSLSLSSVIVVFDGARLDNRKIATVLERAQKRVDYSSRASVNIELSPPLIRQVFLQVLDELMIPYISALGEGDDECVSLANHLDCYLIARDSDYYCHYLVRGYIPFDYVDVNAIAGETHPYLPARLFTVDSLCERFAGLNPSTLALAFCLCGNDHVKGARLKPLLDHITATVSKANGKSVRKALQTNHWYALQWVRRFDHVNDAFNQLMQVLTNHRDQKGIEQDLRLALNNYLHPTDTLIYRFQHPANENLRKNSHFQRLADEFLERIDRVNPFDLFVFILVSF